MLYSVRGASVELRHLRGFIATAEEGSVTRAAARLYIAQPALSRQLHELERQLGRRLFVRHARGVHLTGPGSRMLEQARAVVAAADRLVQLSSAAADDVSDDLTIGALDDGAAESDDTVLAAVGPAHPDAGANARHVA